MKIILDRETDQPFFRVLTNDGVEFIKKETVVHFLDVEKAIRITEQDYPDHLAPGSLIYHFGLPLNADFVGTIVALARISEHGFFLKNGEEKIPLLSFNNVWQATIEERIPQTTYDQLSERFLKNTVGRVTDIDSVKNLILNRYRHSLPDLTDEEIIARGVSVRLLKLIKKVSLPETL